MQAVDNYAPKFASKIALKFTFYNNVNSRQHNALSNIVGSHLTTFCIPSKAVAKLYMYISRCSANSSIFENLICTVPILKAAV